MKPQTSRIFQEAPATMGLILASAVMFVTQFIMQRQFPLESLVLSSASVAAKPWTLLSYMLVQPAGAIWVLLSMVFLWFVGSALERTDGPRALLAYFFGFGFIGGLLFLLGAAVSTQPALMAGSAVSMAAMVCIWASRNPTAPLMFFGVIPMQAKWLAVLIAAMTFFQLGTGQIMAAAFAALSWLGAWYFGKSGYKFPKRKVVVSGRGRQQTKAEYEMFMADVKKREQEREERERLRKLFESSLGDEPPPRER